MATVLKLKPARRTIYRSPDQPLRVLGPEEQKAILRATRDHRRGYRDHLMFFTGPAGWPASGDHCGPQCG